ncbi:MAG: MBL fold metallo-hydrolase, partial [Deltaproteobacteria bacterium]
DFLGAAREVTGSMALVRSGDSRVLVDCGLFQGSERSEARNRSPFPVDPASIDAVVLTHAHLDHSGRLPLLVREGFRGRIVTHRATAELCAILLKDAAFLAERDAKTENRKRARRHLEPAQPLFTAEDAERACERFHPTDYGLWEEIATGVRVCLRDAGHILGSAIAELDVRAGGHARRVVFSGDLGHRGAPVLRDPARIDGADLVVMESTYGDRLHRPWEHTWRELGEILLAADRDRGNVLVPAFAVGRSQEILYAFHQNFDRWRLGRWQIFLDSPMAIEATRVYTKHAELYDEEASAVYKRAGNAFTLPNLRITRTAAESAEINEIDSGAIVIAGSGMCTGGRIRHHLKHNLWRRGCHVLIVGFQARGTLGRSLVDGAKRVSLWGERIEVAASVHTVGGLSAHADREGLISWYERIGGRPPVVLNHGEPRAVDSLAEVLESAAGARVLVARPRGRVDLKARKPRMLRART